LKPDGNAFFIDSLFEQTSTAVNHIALHRSGMAQRKLNDGREFRIVKVFYEPKVLEKRLKKDGWEGQICSTGKFFYYGCMSRPKLR